MKPLSYREVIKKTRNAGFILRRKTSGTHEIWWKEVKPGTLKSIIKQMGLSESEFKEL